MANNKSKDFTGDRYGKLVAKEVHRKTKRGTMWVFQCDCGQLHYNLISQVRSGRTRSCGCIVAKRKHGHGSKFNIIPEYRAWSAMKGRCDNPNNIKYYLVGAKGIRYQESWKEYVNFINDMGFKPKGTVLKRLDTRGDYTKENCRWLTPREVAASTSMNHDKLIGVRFYGKRYRAVVEYEGKNKILGKFDTAIEAAIERDRFIFNVFRQVIGLNYPERVKEHWNGVRYYDSKLV